MGRETRVDTDARKIGVGGAVSELGNEEEGGWFA
jgi:hypothetical protein